MLTPEQIADGWIEHDGSPHPPQWEATYLTMRRDGTQDVRIGRAAYWLHTGSLRDIIAYKPEPTL